MSKKMLSMILVAAVCVTVGHILAQPGGSENPNPDSQTPPPRPERSMDPESRRNRPPRGENTAALKPPLPQNETEKKILVVLEEMNRGESRGMMNVSPTDGRLLRLLTESLGAQQVVEIGTSNGYSAIWFSLALRTTGGKLITHELDAGRAALARKNFQRAGVDGLITLVEGNAHETVSQLEGPIDILFLDADKEGYCDYLKKLLPKVRPGGLILAHNTNMSRSMKEYLDAVTTDPALETLFLFQEGAGIGVTLKKRE